MQLSATQMQHLTEALLAAFYKKANLAQMVRFGLNEHLDVIAGGNDLSEIAFNLVQWAEAYERIEDLLIGARKQNAGNSKLKAISQELLAATLDVSQEQLELIVQQSATFTDIEFWLEQIRLCSQAVCRIEFPEGKALGSGFLLITQQALKQIHGSVYNKIWHIQALFSKKPDNWGLKLVSQYMRYWYVSTCLKICPGRWALIYVK